MRTYGHSCPEENEDLKKEKEQVTNLQAQLTRALHSPIPAPIQALLSAMLQADVQFRPDTSCTPSSSKEKQLWDALLLSEHKSSETFTEEYHKDNYWGIIITIRMHGTL